MGQSDVSSGCLSTMDAERRHPGPWVAAFCVHCANIPAFHAGIGNLYSVLTFIKLPPLDTPGLQA